MARQPAARLQLSAYRFLVRRMEHALLRRDTSMIDDPIQAQSRSIASGLVLAIVAVAGCGILAMVRPVDALGDATIVMGRDSGALYVRVGDTLHSVLNLASARLIAGAADNPDVVAESELRHAKRGPVLGIPGAPAAIAEPLTAAESAWTVCDAGSTTVFVGAVPPGADQLAPGGAVLVKSSTEDAAYLLYRGRRAQVDLGDRAVVRALRLEGIAPRPVSSALLNVIPEVPPIARQVIPRAGQPGPASMGHLAIGTVVRVNRADVVEHYVVLANGVQRIGEVAADLIRFAHSQGDREIVTVAPDTVAGTAMVAGLAVTMFPERAGALRNDAVLCATWSPGPGVVHTSILNGSSLPLPAGHAPVNLARADGDGPNVDAVYVPPGRSVYVRATGLTGDTSGLGPLYLVTDTGVRFGIQDGGAASTLGLASDPLPVPWPVLKLLAAGPQLSKDGALVAHDAVAPATG